MQLIPPDFGTTCLAADGFPRPDWESTDRWIDEHVPAASRHEATCAVERLWLEHVAGYLGGGYRIAESDRFLLLYDDAAVDADALLRTAEETLALVEDALESAANDPARRGKLPVLVFTEDDDFYDYISHFYPDGHYGTFAGVCIREGDVHVALRCPEGEIRRTLAHELAHACLSHLTLPLWLEEGVVEVITCRVVDDYPRSLDSQARDRHYAHWSFRGLAGFWDGSAFFRPDELQYLSYELADALVRRMNAHDPAAFDRFLLAATRDDGGENAAREELGQSLVVHVEEILGEGPWLPPARADDEA